MAQPGCGTRTPCPKETFVCLIYSDMEDVMNYVKAIDEVR